MPQKLKRTYRQGYVYDCRVKDGAIQVLIGIPYPNCKWFNYIESRPGALDSMFRDFGVIVTRNPLIDCSNLQTYLRSHDYTVVRLSKPVGSKENTYFIKFMGHDAIPGYPQETSEITWGPKPIKEGSITRDDAIKFLGNSILTPVLKRITPFRLYSDIPRENTLIFVLLKKDWDMYAPVLEAAYGTKRLMVPELYLRNHYQIPEDDYRNIGDQIRNAAAREKPDELHNINDII